MQSRRRWLPSPKRAHDKLTYLVGGMAAGARHLILAVAALLLALAAIEPGRLLPRIGAGPSAATTLIANPHSGAAMDRDVARPSFILAGQAERQPPAAGGDPYALCPSTNQLTARDDLPIGASSRPTHQALIVARGNQARAPPAFG